MDKVNASGLLIPQTSDTSQKKIADESERFSFTEKIKEELDYVNSLQIKSAEATQALITGEADNIHEILITNEEAMLALEMAVQVRNKIVEAYQEIMKTQI
ncbi:MAG: flagellar hook-basal body complex protein FliE [Clostridiales bacterium]|nr:flagellar hook-basal body complex protein FliE [Clostridiales bacterium]